MTTRPFEELREHGLLWLINRTVFHPRGYALGLSYPEDASREDIEAHRVQPVGFTILGDGTEPWNYDNEMHEDAPFEAAEALFASLRPDAVK